MDYRGIEIKEDAPIGVAYIAVAGAHTTDLLFRGYRPNDSGTGWVPNGIHPWPYIGDPIYPEPNIPMYPGPGDYYPERIWPQYPYPDDRIPGWPKYPPYDAEEIEKIIKQAEKIMNKTPENVRIETVDKDRLISILVPGLFKDQISITLENGKIVIKQLIANENNWPARIDLSLDYDEKDEEITSASLANGILCIMVKNVKKNIPPKQVPIITKD